MDKNNEYYGIIEEIVKNHRKFPGYEAIKEDIIDDVFSHSEMIIKTISNENVIKAYFEKVVSTSIITVPKRLGYNKPVTAQNVSQTEIPSVAIEEQKPYEYSEQPTATVTTNYHASTEYVDKMINTSSEAIVLSSGLAEDIAAETDNIIEELPNETEEIEITEQDFSNDNDDGILESVAEDLDLGNSIEDENHQGDNETEDFTANDIIEEIESNDVISEAEKQADEVFVNDIQASVTEENFDIPKDEIIEDKETKFQDDSDDVYELNIEETTEEDVFSETNSEMVEDDNDYPQEIVELSEEPEANSTEILKLQEENDFIENNIEESVSFEEEIPAEDLLAAEDNYTDEQELLGDLQDVDSLDEYTEEESLLEIETDDTEILQSDISSVSEITSEDIISANDAKKDEIDNLGSIIDYKKFSYTPTKEKSVNISEETGYLVKELLELNEKNPELNILKVYDLRYKQNFDISSISEELSMSHENVIKALNEIVDLI